MNREKLSPQGPTFSRIVSGVWRWHTVDASQREKLIKEAIDLGITTFDHADIYGNYSIEELFGKVLKKEPSLRKKMELVSKCGICLKSDKKPSHQIKHYNTSKEYILQSVHQSLKNLQTEYLDLLLIHRPDPLMNTEEVAEAFEMLKRDGKVLHFGVSNFTNTQFELLNSYFPLVTNQIEISALQLETFDSGMLDLLQKLKISPMAWSPLGSGLLFKEAMDERVFKIQQTLKELSEKYSCTWDQVLLAWLLKHPSRIFPILGTTKTERFSTALKALEIDFDLQDWFKVLAASRGHDVP